MGWVAATREETLCIAVAVVVVDNPAGDFGYVGSVAVDDVAVGDVAVAVVDVAAGDVAAGDVFVGTAAAVVAVVVLYHSGIADVLVAVGIDSSDAANDPLAATSGFAAASSSVFDVASRTLPRPRTRLRSDFSLEFTGIKNICQGFVANIFIFRNGKILSDKIPHTVQIVFWEFQWCTWHSAFLPATKAS